MSFRESERRTDGSPSGGGQPDCDQLLEHRRWLRTVIYARTGSSEAVDEVLQEVLLAACTAKGPSDPAKLAPWLYRIAVRQALLFRRKMGRRRRATARCRERLTEADSVDSDPLRWLLLDERRRLVREALEHLPPAEAEILLLKYSEDWSYRQLAEHLGATVSAVQARLHRARQHLRAELSALADYYTVSEPKTP